MVLVMPRNILHGEDQKNECRRPSGSELRCDWHHRELNRSIQAKPGEDASCEIGPMAGTSMATPVVAGVAAMIRQYFVQVRVVTVTVVVVVEMLVLVLRLLLLFDCLFFVLVSFMLLSVLTCPTPCMVT